LTDFLNCSALLVLLCFTSVATYAEDAKKQELEAYTLTLPYTDIDVDMLPIPGGVFKMGSPKTEKDRADDEGPVHEVKIEPFWMAKFETTWDEYDTFRYKLDVQRRQLARLKATDNDKKADAITRPTKEYRDMTFGMGHDGYPASCMTQLAAKAYCEWLSAATGDYYRLPTEA